MDDLLTRGHLDDAAFARQWVTTRSARGYGAARLRAELRTRGVAVEIIDTVLGELDGGDALERARAVAVRRLPALRGGDPLRAASRLRDHLLRRGYSAGIVARVVREVLTDIGGLAAGPPSPPTLGTPRRSRGAPREEPS